MQKATIRRVPLILLIYITAFIDRVNLGFATNELKVHVGMSAGAHALGASGTCTMLKTKPDTSWMVRSRSPVAMSAS